MELRPYRPQDADALAQIYFDAVRIGAAPKYSAAALAAWAPERPKAAVWAARLQGLITQVASDRTPIGFMSLCPTGRLDLAYVAPEWRGKGVADALHDAILVQARALKLPALTTEASLMARPFFLRMGWQMVAAQTAVRNGVSLENFRMSFALTR